MLAALVAYRGALGLSAGVAAIVLTMILRANVVVPSSSRPSPSPWPGHTAR